MFIVFRKMNRVHLSFLLGLCALSLLIAGCAAAPPSSTPATVKTESPVTAASPTRAATATNAPLPTNRPSPTATQTPTNVPTSVTTATSPASAAANESDWTTYHRDNAHTGYLPDLPDPQQLAVAWNTALDGAVYAEPLVSGGHVLVATENNSLYSLNAQSGQVEWQTNIGKPITRAQLPCGNIEPLGITGTPVYDPASGLVFAVAEVQGPAHMLVGVDARTGQIRVHRSADPGGMDVLAHQQRAALVLSQGMVYVAYGGLFGDCGNYHGWVVASRTDGSGALLAYQVPTTREGGIWAPAGPAASADGHIFVSVGNGAGVTGNWDNSDSVLRLSPTLQLEDGFAPEQWQQDNMFDADLGSLGPVLLPDGSIFIAGKSGIGYVLHADKLGGVGGQIAAKEVCHAYGGAALVGSTVFVPCNEGVQQLQVAGANLILGWRADQVPGSPVVGGHTVYAMDRGGMLHALDLQTGADRATVRVGNTSRFATPTLYQNRVFIGTLTGIVAVIIS